MARNVNSQRTILFVNKKCFECGEEDHIVINCSNKKNDKNKKGKKEDDKKKEEVHYCLLVVLSTVIVELIDHLNLRIIYDVNYSTEFYSTQPRHYWYATACLGSS